MGIKTGGSAFPNDGSWGNGYPEPGATLRQWYAGKAMAAFLASDVRPYCSPQEIAVKSLACADALIAEEAAGR